MIRMSQNNGINILAGQIPETAKANRPFSEEVCDFFSALSAALLRDPAIKSEADPDVISFAFWCRKSQIEAMHATFKDEYIRLGRGIAFHISPGNVPVNAFYSFAFGLLSGNANIVRLASKKSGAVDSILTVINQLFAEPQFSSLAATNAFIRYDRDNLDATKQLSARCDARIIWGGDAAINDIRKSPISPRTHEIAFADRYSFAVLDAKTIAALSAPAIERAAVNFYNDTLLMDQNACSSPHLIAWLNGEDTAAKTRFWQAFTVYRNKKADLEPVEAVDRHTRLLSGFITGPEQQLQTQADDSLLRVKLLKLPADMDRLRGVHGLFYEYDIKDLDDLAHIVNNKYQTLTYLGPDKIDLADFVIKNRLDGIDRIVPVGDALAINAIWDGHAVLKELTRILDVR